MNSAAANAATVPPLDRADPSLRGAGVAREPVTTNRASSRSNTNPLWLRIVSALVLAPLPIAAIWFGWPWLPLLTGAGRCGNGMGMGPAMPRGSIWPDRDRAGRGRSGGGCGRRARLSRAGARHRPAGRGFGVVGGAPYAGCRAPMDGFRRALGGAALRLSLMAGGRWSGRPGHLAMAAGGRLGDRHRRLRHRPDLWWATIGAPLEPAKDLGRAGSGARPARLWLGGPPRHGSESLRLCRWRSSARALRLSSSSAILPSPWQSAGSA